MEIIGKEQIESAHKPEWFAVQTRHHHEKSVATRLGNANVETFLPVHRSLRKWSNGVRSEVNLPLFPCYLFTHISPAQRIMLLQTPGVIGLAASNVSPTPISETEITSLRIATERVKTEPHPYLNVGERVRITSGMLAGMEGILVRKRHELRVVLSLEAIMRSIMVEVSEFEIEPLGFRNRGWN
jgi:transcription antitermination factor NusG